MIQSMGFCVIASARSGKGRALSLSVKAEGKKATISIVGEISRWYNGYEDFKAQITKAIADGATDVHVYINTEGGDVFQANEIANEIARFKGAVTGEGGSLVASAGTYIAMKIENFTMAANGQFMIHKPYGYVGGNADQIEGYIKLLRNLEDEYVSSYAKRTGKTEDEIRALWSKGDYWLSAKEAMEQGFISGITGEETITSDMALAIRACGAPVVPTPQDKPTPKQDKPTSNMNELKIMAALLGLSADADLAAVQAKMIALKSKADKADQLQAQIDTIKENERTALAQKRANEFKTLFDAKVTAKAITEDYRATFAAKYDANPEACKAELESLKPVLNITDHITPGGGNPTAGISDDRKDWKYGDWVAKDAKGLRALAKTNKESYIALFNAQYGRNPSDETIEALTGN